MTIASLAKSLPSGAAAALLAGAIVALATLAQPAPQAQAAPQAGQQPTPPSAAPAEGAPRPQRNYPPPTNLKVLPKDLTGAQVRDVMHHWAGDLGQECNACHAADPNQVDERGRPRLNFADDSKPEKQMARIMYTMTEDLKKNYVSKVEALDTMGSPAPPVTCGTCHRGHLDPEAYIPPRREHEHDGPEHPPAAPPAN